MKIIHSKLCCLIFFMLLTLIPKTIFCQEKLKMKRIDVTSDIEIYMTTEEERIYPCNITVIRNGKEVMLIDTAYEVEARLVAADLNRRGLTVTQVILSHGHADHSDGFNVFKGAEYYCSAFYKNDINAKDPKMKQFKPERLLKEGDRLSFGKHAIRIWQSTGHSASGLVIIIDDSILHVGDLLFFSKDDKLCIPYIGGKIDDHIEDLKRIRAFNPAIILPGHGKAINIKADGFQAIDRILHYMEKFKAGDDNVRLEDCVLGDPAEYGFHQIHPINIRYHKSPQKNQKSKK